MKNSRVRIKLRGFDAKLVDDSAKIIVNSLKEANAIVSGPIFLPTEKDIYCVQRCTTIDKESMEHFETRTHKRLIEIKNSNKEIMDKLRTLHLSSGVDVQIKA